MSTAKFDTLQNVAGTKSVPVSTVVDGSAKAWVNFNGTGTVAIRASFNVSSITDNGSGYYTVNFTTSLSDANYAVVASSVRDVNNTNASTDMFCANVITNAQAAGSFTIKTGYPSGINTVEDSPWTRCVVFR